MPKYTPTHIGVCNLVAITEVPIHIYLNIPTPRSVYRDVSKPTPHQEMLMLTAYEQNMYCDYELSVQLSKSLAVSRCSVMVSQSQYTLSARPVWSSRSAIGVL